MAVTPRTPPPCCVVPAVVAPVEDVDDDAEALPLVLVELSDRVHEADEELLKAWTATACLCLQFVTLCGWPLPGPETVPAGAPEQCLREA